MRLALTPLVQARRPTSHDLPNVYVSEAED
jgi:hypothetical protein